jgi:hypothetical protein
LNSLTPRKLRTRFPRRRPPVDADAGSSATTTSSAAPSWPGRNLLLAQSKKR